MIPAIALLLAGSACATVLTEQCEGDTYNFSFRLVNVADIANASAVAEWGRDEAGNCYVLRIDHGKADLLKRDADRERLIATAVGLSLPSLRGEAASVVVGRRSDRLWVEADGARVFTCFDRAHFAGDIEITGNGVAVKDLELQELGELSFGDDFLRDASNHGEWETETGEWQLTVFCDPKIKREGGAVAATWFESKGADENIAVAGYPFWDDIRVGLSCRADSASSVGLVFNYLKPTQYCVAHLSREGQLELVEVSGGERRALTSCAIPWDGQDWKRLEVIAWDRSAQVLVNGVRLLQAGGLTASRGKIGVLASGAGARFDDVEMESVSAFWDDFSSGSLYRWDAPVKSAQVANSALNLTASSRTVALARTPGLGDYQARCSLASGSGERGLVFGWQSPSDFWALESSGSKAWRLTRVSQGQSAAVAEGTADGGATRSLRVDVTEQFAECYVDGTLVCRRVQDDGMPGRVGLTSSAKRAQFQDFAAYGTAPRRVSVLASDFTVSSVIGKNKHEVWNVVGDLLVPARGKWKVTKADGGARVVGVAKSAPAVLQFRDPMPGDVCVQCEFPPGASLPGAALVASDLSVRYLARLTGEGSTLELLREGEVVAHQVVQPADDVDARILQLERVGRCYVARCDGSAVSFYDVSPLAADRVSLVVEGGTAAANAIEILGRNALAYPFDKVEPDWRPATGKWVFHSGMTCIPWSYWITADGRQEPALQWNQYKLPDDFDLDFYVSEHTVGEEDLTHYHFPYHDIAVVLCGDGANLDSGYRLLIGCDGGRGSRLYRKGEVVAKAAIPTIVMGGHCNEPRQIRVHIRREDGKLTVTGNGATIFEYQDAEPLGPGQFALGAAKCRANFSDLYVAALQTWENQLPSP